MVNKCAIRRVDCPNQKICNPKTGRCVKIDGEIGKRIVSKQGRSSPRRSPVRSPRRRIIKEASKDYFKFPVHIPEAGKPDLLNIYGVDMRDVYVEPTESEIRDYELYEQAQNEKYLLDLSESELSEDEIQERRRILERRERKNV